MLNNPLIQLYDYFPNLQIRKLRHLAAKEVNKEIVKGDIAKTGCQSVLGIAAE